MRRCPDDRDDGDAAEGEIEFLRELYRQAQDLLTAVGDLVLAELAAGNGELAEGTPLRAVADRLDEALLCFDLLQQELGLPEGTGPRYGRMRTRGMTAIGPGDERSPVFPGQRGPLTIGRDPSAPGACPVSSRIRAIRPPRA